MRGICRFLAAGVSLLATACATLRPEDAAREALIWEAAKECEARFATVRVQRVDQYARVWFTYGSPGEHNAFLACHQSQVQEKTKRTPLVSPGRLSLPVGAPARISVPVQVGGGRPFVEVTLNASHRATLLVDTGASQTILSPAVAERLGISPPVSAFKQISTVVGGKTITYPLARVRSLRVGDFTVEDIDVGVYDAFPGAPGVDGLLGGTFLNHFRVTVDQAARHLTLEAVAAPSVAGRPPAEPSAASGIRPADLPRWTPGEEWSYRWESPRGRGTFVWVVDREETVDGVPHYVLKSGGAREIYFRAVDFAYAMDVVNGKVETRHVPPTAWAPWPLTPGKTWELRYTRERPLDRQAEEMLVTCEAAAEEVVTVPAGTFTALRVVCRNARTGSLLSEIWYSAAVKQMVRERTHFSYGVRERELIAFKLS